jgi:hypothetical protein
MRSWENFRLCLIIVGVVLPVAAAAAFVVRIEFPAVGCRWAGFPESVRWPFHAVGVAFFLLLAAAELSYDSPLTLLFAFLALMEMTAVAQTIRRHRSQWTLRTLIGVTSLAAVVCSLATWGGQPMLLVLAAAAAVALLAILLAEALRWHKSTR